MRIYIDAIKPRKWDVVVYTTTPRVRPIRRVLYAPNIMKSRWTSSTMMIIQNKEDLLHFRYYKKKMLWILNFMNWFVWSTDVGSLHFWWWVRHWALQDIWLEDVFQAAVQRGYTAQGEMFSGVSWDYATIAVLHSRVVEAKQSFPFSPSIWLVLPGWASAGMQTPPAERGSGWSQLLQSPCTHP